MAFAHNYIRFNRRQTIKRHNKRAAPAGLANPGAAPQFKKYNTQSFQPSRKNASSRRSTVVPTIIESKAAALFI